MPRTIYTIGTEGTSISAFMNTMTYNLINAVIDMREEPENPSEGNFKKSQLIPLLGQYKIYYRQYPELIENKIRPETQEYKKRISIIENAMKQGYTFCLLSSPKFPLNSQRCTLVGHQFYRKEFRVIHLYPKDGINKENPARPEPKWKNFIYHEELLTRIERRKR